MLLPHRTLNYLGRKEEMSRGSTHTTPLIAMGDQFLKSGCHWALVSCLLACTDRSSLRPGAMSPISSHAGEPAEARRDVSTLQARWNASEWVPSALIPGFETIPFYSGDKRSEAETEAPSTSLEPDGEAGPALIPPQPWERF